MNRDRFFELTEYIADRSISMLESKGEEYSKEDNKLHNFDVGAKITGKLREEVLLGFLLKHQISLLDIIEDIKVNKLPSRELIDSKLGDIINYHILLEASIIDRIDKEEIERERRDKEVLTN